MVEERVGPGLVVFPPPGPQLLVSIQQIVQLARLRIFVPQTAVERFDKRVLRGWSCGNRRLRETLARLLQDSASRILERAARPKVVVQRTGRDASKLVTYLGNRTGPISHEVLSIP